MHRTEVTEALGQVVSKDTGAVAIKHGIDKQAVVLRRRSYTAGSTGQEAFDVFPLGVCQDISCCYAPDNVALDEFNDTP